HIVTGCSANTQVLIEQNTLPIPAPEVLVRSHVTSCIDPNGALEASVNGNTSDYIFHWFDSSPTQPADTARADFRSEVYSELAEGTYYVVATSRITGCISAPADNTILEAP